MKIVTFELATPVGRVRRLGAFADELPDMIVDLNAAFCRSLADGGEEPTPREYAALRLPPDMLGWLRAGRPGMNAAQQAIAYVSENVAAIGLDGETLLHPRASVRLIAPLPRPTAFRDFSIYEEHMTRAEGKPFEKAPDWYVTPPYYIQGQLHRHLRP